MNAVLLVVHVAAECPLTRCTPWVELGLDIGTNEYVPKLRGSARSWAWSDLEAAANRVDTRLRELGVPHRPTEFEVR